LLKYFSLFAALLLLPFSSLEAREWNISIPSWIGTLSETLATKTADFAASPTSTEASEEAPESDSSLLEEISQDAEVAMPVAFESEAEDAFKRREIACVALAVYYESRGESIKGQRAVASVVMNRVRDNRFPSTACEVLIQRKQFSFMNTNPVLRPTGAPWDRAVGIASEFANRSTGEVPYLFFSSERGLKGHRIGNHVFR
jgi:hypothetical protein